MDHRKYLREPSKLLAFFYGDMKKERQGFFEESLPFFVLGQTVGFGLYLIKDVLPKQLDGV